jgi:hypothetical protein
MRDNGQTLQRQRGRPPLLRAPLGDQILAPGGRRSFRFEAQSGGSFTARAERRGNATYWYAYRKIGSRLHKAYIGRDDTLVETRLEQVATELDRLARSNQSSMPRRVGSFVGRARELDEVCRLTRGHRLVTLTGVGGIGKTRLALAVAARVENRSLDVYLVDLARVGDAELVLSAIAGAVGVYEQPRRALQDVVVDTLRNRGCLLVLDNCEHLVEAASVAVAELLAQCPRRRVLTTSRERLGCEGEVVWPVPPLSLPRLGSENARHSDSVRLFVQRAAAACTGFALTARNVADVLDMPQSGRNSSGDRARGGHCFGIRPRGSGRAIDGGLAYSAWTSEG